MCEIAARRKGRPTIEAEHHKGPVPKRSPGVLGRGKVRASYRFNFPRDLLLHPVSLTANLVAHSRCRCT